jgi:hypothetical protein
MGVDFQQGLDQGMELAHSRNGAEALLIRYQSHFGLVRSMEVAADMGKPAEKAGCPRAALS